MIPTKVLRICAIMAVVFLCTMTGVQAYAAPAQNGDDREGSRNQCRNLPGYAALKAALDAAVSAETSGLNLHMWRRLSIAMA